MSYLDFTNIENEVGGMEFYKAYPTTEHLLKAEELAIIYGIYTKTDKPASNFVRALLDYSSQDISGYTQLYYINKKGHKVKVYERFLYKETLEKFVLGVFVNNGQNMISEININDKNYSVVVTEDFKKIMDSEVTGYDLLMEYYKGH